MEMYNVKKKLLFIFYIKYIFSKHGFLVCRKLQKKSKPKI